jgi:hypothetical protein
MNKNDHSTNLDSSTTTPSVPETASRCLHQLSTTTICRCTTSSSPQHHASTAIAISLGQSHISIAFLYILQHPIAAYTLTPQCLVTAVRERIGLTRTMAEKQAETTTKIRHNHRREPLAYTAPSSIYNDALAYLNSQSQSRPKDIHTLPPNDTVSSFLVSFLTDHHISGL